MLVDVVFALRLRSKAENKHPSMRQEGKVRVIACDPEGRPLFECSTSSDVHVCVGFPPGTDVIWAGGMMVRD